MRCGASTSRASFERATASGVTFSRSKMLTRASCCGLNRSSIPAETTSSGFWMAHFRSSDCLKRFDPAIVPPSLRQALVVSGCWIAGKGSEDAAARPRSMAGRLRRSAATRSSRDVRARGRVSTIASGLSTQAHRSARHVARRTRHELQARRTETAPAAASRTQDPHLERALVRVPVLGAVDDERFDDATRIEQPRSTRCVWLP
jgi:hypothetical protein